MTKNLLFDIPEVIPFKYVYSHTKLDTYLLIDTAIREILKQKSKYLFTFKINENKLIPSEFNGNGGIYILFNRTNNKVYVGQTGNVYRRVLEHKQHMLKRALKANDDLVVKFIPLAEPKLRSFWERWFIKYYQVRYDSCNTSTVLIDNINDYNFKSNLEDYDA